MAVSLVACPATGCKVERRGVLMAAMMGVLPAVSMGESRAVSMEEPQVARSAVLMEELREA